MGYTEEWSSKYGKKFQEPLRARCVEEKNAIYCSSEHAIGVCIPMPPVLEGPEFITALW